MSKRKTKSRPMDLRCDQCGAEFNGFDEALTAGDLCPQCEQYHPAEAGTLRDSKLADRGDRPRSERQR